MSNFDAKHPESNKSKPVPSRRGRASAADALSRLASMPLQYPHDPKNGDAEAEAKEGLAGEAEEWVPEYDPWRHGGFYVTNITYPSGAVGCVHNNHHSKDGKWRIVNDRTETSFPTRDAAAKAERVAVAMLHRMKIEPSDD